MRPAAIIPKICEDETLHDLAITNFIADMIACMEARRPDFNTTNFRLYKECGNLMVSVRDVQRTLEGYNYAHPVKQVMDAITEAGFFS